MPPFFDSYLRLRYLCARENTLEVMNIEQKLVTSVIGGLKALYGQDVPAAQVQLQKTKKEFEGHLTLVVFPFLRMSKKGPEQTAQEIGEYLQANEPSVAAFNVIKGFLNLTIASATWVELLLSLIHIFSRRRACLSAGRLAPERTKSLYVLSNRRCCSDVSPNASFC